MKVVGFCQGGPFDPHSWSGSNRGIFSALKKNGVLLDVFDVELTGWRRYWEALREYSSDTKVWKHNFLKSPHQFDIRTQTASRYLSQTLHAGPDAGLQIGAMFNATARHPLIPRFCYLDSNSALSNKGGKESFGHHAKTEYKELSFKREQDIYSSSLGLFAFSNYLKDSLVNDFGIPAKTIHTVYAGVNIKTPTRQSPAIKKPVILFIGRDFDRKGGPLLLTAFARVKRKIPNAKLIIAGCSPRIDEAGVEILGFIDKNSKAGENRLIHLYKQAAVFSMPSHFEPFGIVYAEAMHYGVPCVGVRHCAMPEIITDGITGLLTEPGNDRELADALITIIDNPALAKNMGAEGIKKANNLFRWEIVVEKMIAVVENTLAPGTLSKVA
jgi:glycosyltransferase involved in cell wall biosynthesis